MFYIHFDNKDKIKQLIISLKTRYDDEWKKINLINSSIKLNIELDVDSKNVLLIEKVEKILSEIELIEKFSINYFNNEKTSFSILSNSTPNKLKSEFEKFNLNISSDNNVWVLNE